MGLSSICLFTMFILLVFPFFFLNFTIANVTASSMLPLCHDDERSALLQFKESRISGDFYAWKFDCRPTMASWKPEEGSVDCCSWDGVHCNKNTGHVIKLDLSHSCLFGSIDSSSSLFKLVHLEWLNLALNDFNSSEIPPEIINLSRLSYLNLSGTSLSGQIPSEILKLSNLVSLDLSLNDVPGGRLELQKPSFTNLVEKLTNLKTLDLGDVSIDSTIPHNIGNLSSLTFVSLRNCELQGRIPSSLGNLSKLLHLDLSLNELQGELPVSVGNLHSLKELDLSANFLSSEWPISIGNLSSLKELDLSQNRFFGELPISMGNLGSLKELDLSHNAFFGELPTSIRNLFSLEKLDLSFNKFSGEFPWSTGNFSSLKLLDLRSCSFWGKVPHSIGNFTRLQFLYPGLNSFSGDLLGSIGNLRSLEVIHIPKCNFSGQITSSLRNLTQLIVLDMARNSYSGMIELDVLLTSWKNLEHLSLSSNRLSVLTKATSNTTSKKHQYIKLRSCNLTKFPNFLESQHHLVVLDLSDNRIRGKVPKWLLDPNMQNLIGLNLSHNLLTGFDQHPVFLPGNKGGLVTFDLSSNNLQGPLPVPPPGTINYLASNNSLTGEIPSWICNLNFLKSLVLSHNNLSGLLPQCLSNFSDELSVLDLRGNNFFGTIPNTFIKESRLSVIDLSHNLFQGRIPRSLINCSKLEFLGLGNNQISDTFPSWLGTLPNLNVLILRSNIFYGIIEEPRTDCGFSKLRIIDLSNNRFTGTLPSKSFLCWNAMKIVNTSELRYLQDVLFPYGQVSNNVVSTYDYSMTMNSKGRMMTYKKIPDILAGIILSNNRFDGAIPASIANLKGLQVLNLHNNNLQGHIPSCLGNLTNLESLDLSDNKFSGRIPQQLVELTFLEFFNVSDNYLTGPIPQGKQFATFDNTSFDGNSGLCGRPLSKGCESDEAPTNEDHNEGSEESLFSSASDWKIILTGYAGGLVAGLVLGCNFSTGIIGWILEKLGTQQKATRRRRRRRN
ncbi:Receptor-like protein 6 [Citrus sinensis]|uniref:Receptor-like protein 6 n=1 Tax=Citrus sinensis TaxID=2711 RepID=A0ACB8KDN4_CITSI|nr:Receptor-like protein 6 [Citrus sinensis]